MQNPAGMKRILLVAVLALPGAVLAQVSAANGQVVEIDNYNAAATTSYLNAEQCADTAGAPKVHLEWNIVASAGSPSSGSYRVYASDQAPATSGTDANFCLQDNTTNPDHFAGLVAQFAVRSAVQQEFVSGTEISARTSSLAGTQVCANEGKEVWVCAHWYDSNGTRSGYASGKFTVQLAAPARPTGVAVGSAPGSLTVRWTASTGGTIGADHYIASAQPLPPGSDIPEPGAPTFTSSAVNGTGPVTISGLSDGTRYRVVVVAYSVGGNPSAESDPVIGTPTPVDDFWKVYENAGGREQGGCGAGGAGPVALLAVAGLLAALRRRK